MPVACREAGISDVSYYRWRRKSAVGEIGNKEVRGHGLQNHGLNVGFGSFPAVPEAGGNRDLKLAVTVRLSGDYYR